MASPALPMPSVPDATTGTTFHRLASASLRSGNAWPSSGEDFVTRAYVTLLEHPSPTPDFLVERGFSPEDAEGAILVLADRGLISLLDDGSIDVPPPDVALLAYATELERSAKTSRAAAGGLTQLYHRARALEVGAAGGLGTMDVVVLRSVEELDRARSHVLSTAQHDILRAAARSDRTDAILMEQAELISQEGRIDPTVSNRLVVDMSFLDLDGAMAALDTYAENGVAVRLVPNVVAGMLVVDGTTALVDVTNIDESGYGSVLIRHRPMVEVVRRLVEKAFDAGLPVPRGPLPMLGLDLDQRDAQILALLAAGATDSTIARQVRISQRTVERRLRTIMDLLGVSTRFQAGVQAARRGLV